MNEVRYKVSLCENFQQQNCSIAIPISNGHRFGAKHNPST